jgi:hypothetical protein
MRRMIWAPVLAALLLACGTAWAAPATVNLRVEGATSTIFEAPVTTDGKTIDGHPCDGTTRTTPPNPDPGPTMTSALDDASLVAGFGWTGTWYPFGDFLIDDIASEQGSGESFWGTVLNYEPTPVGGCQQQVAQGDDLLFALGDVYQQPLLKLRGDTRAAVGEQLSLHVTSGTAGSDFTGASVAGVAGQTGADGRMAATFDSPGVKTLKADAPGAIRSNAWQVCVEAPGSGTCSGFSSSLAVTPLSNVTDSAAPTARISGPRNGRRYRHGPRLLRGLAADDRSGVKEVKLALRRHIRGRGCQWWSGRREKFVGRNCHKKFFFSIGGDAKWSYLLPRPLGAGHYVLDVKVFDAAGNRADAFRRGVNRSVFDVEAKRSRKGSRKVGAAAASARVEAMVVGRQGVIVDPITVRAPKTVVRASGRRCAVAASTPLGALHAALHRKRVGFAVRDYGSCARRNTRSSGQLFVTQIARERNSGANGWVYKIDDRTPGTGAADGRLRAGDRLLWLYCEQDPQTGGCQRSLRVVPAGTGGPAGGSLPVRVFGYDDKRTRRSVPGARLTLTKGSQEIVSAVSSLDGSAVLTLPPAGRYELAASADGLAPSFPVTVRVRAR